MTVWLLLLHQALAYPEIRLAPISPQRVAQSRENAKERDGDRELACNDFAEGIALCFRYVSEQRLPIVYTKELKTWSASVDQLMISVQDNAKRHVESSRYEQKKMEDGTGSFWASARKDGWDAAGIFHPETLEEIAGGKILMAIPQSGMFIFWKQGSAALNRSLAAGIKETYKAAQSPVSPYVYRWNGEKWLVWGEAVEKKK